MKPQNASVLDLLRRHPEGITPLEALKEVGTFRLGARIYELKAEGYRIDTEIVRADSGKHVARYRLIEAEQRTLGLTG